MLVSLQLWLTCKHGPLGMVAAPADNWLLGVGRPPFTNVYKASRFASHISAAAGMPVDARLATMSQHYHQMRTLIGVVILGKCGPDLRSVRLAAGTCGGSGQQGRECGCGGSNANWLVQRWSSTKQHQSSQVPHCGHHSTHQHLSSPNATNQHAKQSAAIT